MKQIFKRLFGTMLAMVLVVTMIPMGALSASAAPAAQSAITTGSIITYGSYPQTRVTDSGLIAALNAQPLQGDSTVTYGGSKYKRVYFTQYTPYYTTGTPNASNSHQDDNGYYINTVYWFKFEPLQWRVLSNTNGELFVMADKILASRAYNQAYTDVTWETCTMRSWLNNDFYNTAFNSTERAKIKTSTVVNANNPWYGTSGGNNTNDKLFLLSYSEVMNPAYGFSSSPGNSDTARRAQGTDYSKSQGLYVSTSSSYLENSNWWLRSPGYSPLDAGIVGTDGFVSYYNNRVHGTGVGARPAFKLNLTSDIFTSLTPSFTYDNQKYNKDLAEWTADYCVQLGKSPDGHELESMLQDKSKTIGEKGGYSCIYDSNDYIADGNDPNGIGYIFAVKRVNGNENLISVVIRGTNNAQWQGDMDATGQTYNEARRTHYSFWVGKETVKAKLKWYMNQISGKNVLLITGHSRGAAVANLLAKDMTDNANSYGISKVFGYTYATPNVSLDTSTAYKNIYNFCFTDDFVTRSPLSEWGYGKYGTTFWATAQDLYSDKSKPGFKADMDEVGTNMFDKRTTYVFKDYIKLLNPNTWFYYNSLLPSFNPIPTLYTTHGLLRYTIAPLMTSNNVKKAFAGASILNAMLNTSCIPIISYFAVGANTYIKSTHETYTYDSALRNGGFPTDAKSSSIDSLLKSQSTSSNVTSLSGAEVLNSNAAELQQLRTFAQQGDNLTALGWTLDDISTWTGITWSDETENRVQTIDLCFKNITGTLNLSGFTRLQSLNCAGNQLTAIDLSGCNSLTEAEVSHNNLTEISLPQSSLLEKFECSWNQITSLDVSNCATLKYLYCEYNNLAALDVSNNANLIEFYCDNNNLTQLVVTANIALNTLGCDNNYLDIQDGSAMMTEIQNIMTHDGAWVSYSPQKVPEAAIFNKSDIAELTTFANTDTNLTKLGWDLAKPKDWACVEWVQVGTEYRVKELHFESLELTGIMDLSGMTSLTSLSCNENALTALNLSGCTALQYLTCNNSQLQSLDITNCEALTNLNCENNYLDVSTGTALRTCIDSLLALGNEFIVYQTQMILAEVSAFNAAEYSALSAFAQTGDNLVALGWDINKPGEWQGVKWAFVNGAYRATEIDISGLAVTGDLDVSNFNLLTAIDCSGSGISFVSLPDTLTAIDDSAFSGCDNLTSIVIPNGVQSIGDKVFLGCGSLVNITIGDDVNTIGFGAFAGCSSLANIAVSANNTQYEVVDGVLFDSAGTTLIYYPAGSPAIDYSIPNNVTSIEKGAFFGCPNLERVFIGTGITTISSESFSQCTKLKNVDFPDSLTTIETGAFSYCPAITNLYLPGSVTEIQDNAFLGCSNLEKAIVENNTASIGAQAFSYYNNAYLPLSNLTIYCDEGSSAQAYAIANGLNYYTYKISASPGSNAIINKKNNFIYGLTAGLTSLDCYVDLASGYSMEYVPTPNGFGTGTIANVVNNTKAVTIIESYTIIIFGDINGDENISALDALMTLQNAGGMAAFDDVKAFAGDVNKSGNITSLDALMILQHASGIIGEF